MVLAGGSLFLVKDANVQGNSQAGAAILSMRGILRPNLFTFSGTSAGLGTSTPASQFHVANTPLGDGTSATTTTEFGAATSTSKTCFNVRNTAGEATSFYFVGTTLTVEAKRCI